MKIIEVTENNIHSISEYIEEILKYGGRLMGCLEQLKEEFPEVKGEEHKEEHKESYYRYK